MTMTPATSLKKLEYGEVSGCDNGIFTDAGTDKRTTTISYAASTTPHILGLPSRELLVNQASSTVKGHQALLQFTGTREV